jgi:hypothetical protein
VEEIVTGASQVKGDGARAIVIALVAPLVQIRRGAPVPPVDGRALRALVQQHPLRFFRPAPGGLVADAVWLSSVAGPLALLAAADISELDRIVTSVSGLGLVIDRIAPVGDESAGIDLATRAMQAQRLRHDRGGLATLALVAVGLWGAIGVGYGVRLDREHRLLAARLATLERASTAIGAAKRELEAADRAVSTIDSVAALRGSVLRALSRLGERLPPDAYLASVALEGDSARVTGFARSPAAVVARLGGVGRGIMLLAPRAQAGLDSLGRTPFELVASRRGLR